MNPNVTIEHKKAATSNEARDNLTTRLAAGSGLSDIEGVEMDWLPELLQYPDRFTDLSDPAVEGRWLDWKTDGRDRPPTEAPGLRHGLRARGRLLQRRTAQEGGHAHRTR